MIKKGDPKLKEYVICNLCNSDSTKKIMEINGFNIVKCKKCGLIYVNPRLKFKVLEKIYMDGTYFRNPAFKDFKFTFYGYDRYLEEKKDIMDTFSRRLDVITRYRKNGKLLDIGCAFGFFLELASKRGWKASGIEVSKNASDYAKKHQKSPVFNGTIEKANFKKKSFDVITLFDVIEHIPDPKNMLKKINKLLKPGGILAITTPNIDSLPAKILGNKWEEVRRVREHIYFFSNRTLKKILEKSGFKVLKTESAGRILSFESAIKRLMIYTPRLSRFFAKVVTLFRLNNTRIYVDPHYKITVYAKKRKI